MPDCILIGGGIIGLLTARELNKRNVDVLLIEKSYLGGESSWAGGGIVSPLYPWLYQNSINALAQQSKLIYRKLIDELASETGVDSEFIQSGVLIAGNDEASQAVVWSKKWLEPVSVVTTCDDMQRIEPALNLSFENGVWMPNIHQVRNPKLVAALKASLEQRGISFLENTAVEELVIHDSKVKGVRVDGDIINADKVIIASGAWSSALVNHSINVEPVKGQMIMYKGAPDFLKRIVLFEGHYIIPRADGRILAGSTLEKKGFDKSISLDAMQALHQAAISIMPALANIPVERQWSGLRPGTEQGVPYICEHNKINNLFINTGHYRNGIVLGPASAVLMADLVCESEPIVDKSPYVMDAIH